MKKYKKQKLPTPKVGNAPNAAKKMGGAKSTKKIVRNII